MESSINDYKSSKLSSKSQQENVLDKQVERMMNDQRLLKDDLNALHMNSQLKENLSKNNTKVNRNALKLHTKVQRKVENQLFESELDDNSEIDPSKT